MTSYLERRLWLSLVLLAGLVLVLLAATAHLGGAMPALRPLESHAAAAGRIGPDGHVVGWFAVPPLARLATATNVVDPFYTLYFQPPPPAQPPQTKQIQLLYQGCYTSSSDVRLAYIRYGDATLVLTNGATVVADLVIQRIDVRTLTLTNSTGRTNVLQFDQMQTLEVPARGNGSLATTVVLPVAAAAPAAAPTPPPTAAAAGPGHGGPAPPAKAAAPPSTPVTRTQPHGPRSARAAAAH